jgi:uncharacterized membrane protein
MFYRKNVPGWERLVRLVAGAAIVACGLIGIGMNLPGFAVAAIGIFTGLTGLVGFCPACSMAGRRIANKTAVH